MSDAGRFELRPELLAWVFSMPSTMIRRFGSIARMALPRARVLHECCGEIIRDFFDVGPAVPHRRLLPAERVHRLHTDGGWAAAFVFDLRHA